MPETKKSSQRGRKAASDIHIDEKFLQDHLRDVRSEMSWRRELEFRLLQFLLVFYPIIGTAMISLFQSDVRGPAFSITAVGAAFLILAASAFVTDRINHEHRAYADLGKQVQMIWAYFGLFESGAYLEDRAFLSARLRDEQKGYGQGQGYRKTLGLIWLVTAAMILILIALAVLKT